MIMGHIRKLRRLVPIEAEYEVRNACSIFVPIRYKSRYSAVFHTCVWKTASQWIRVVLSDPRIYMYSGLKPRVPVDSTMWWPKPYQLMIPDRRIVPDLYCDYEQFTQLRKPAPYAVFFVKRDPRDILISWYFSNRYSHRPMTSVNEKRDILANMSERDGILATVDCFDEFASMLRSWIEASKLGAAVRIVRYEDLTGPQNLNAWSELLRHCDIVMPDSVLEGILETYSFVNITGGRRPGEEDKMHKYRKGLAGDWKNYFDAEISARFYERHGNLPQELGYT